MKGLVLLKTITSILLVLVIAALGAYAVIMSVEIVRSKINFELVDITDINLEVTANACWVETSNENYQFTTETRTGGFTSSSWDMPDINFTTSEPVLDSAVLSLTIVNRNEDGGNPVKITLYHIAYDMARENPDDYRFRTQISTSLDSFISKDEIMLNAVTKEYVLNANSSLTIEIEYSLAITNSIFNIIQNINVDFESVVSQ